MVWYQLMQLFHVGLTYTQLRTESEKNETVGFHIYGLYQRQVSLLSLADTESSKQREATSHKLQSRGEAHSLCPKLGSRREKTTLHCSLPGYGNDNSSNRHIRLRRCFQHPYVYFIRPFSSLPSRLPSVRPLLHLLPHLTLDLEMVPT